MKLSLDTIILFVQNVDKLKSFYTTLLKLEILEEDPNEWVLLKAGRCNIGLHKFGDEYLNTHKEIVKSESNVKLVFEIDEDIQKVRAQYIKEKVVMKEIKTFTNYEYWLCDGEDPEGNVFQLKQKK